MSARKSRLGDVYVFQYVPGAMRMFDPFGQPLGTLGLRGRHGGRVPVLSRPRVRPDGYGYSFDGTQGLLRLEITLP
jgi:hypothetical protein